VLIVTRGGQMVTGIPRGEDADAVVVVDAQGNAQRVRKSEIDKRVPQTTSLMPENYRELLTVAELSDLVAFLVSLK